MPAFETIAAAPDFTVTRMGFGAMQLAGKGVFGPPADRDECIAVLREAVETGITHIDTSDFYGPHITNEIIKEALHPYPAELRIVTKVGARRGDDGSWIHDLSPDFLTQSIHDNIDHLGIEAVDAVNLRLGDVHGTGDEDITEPFGALTELQQQGLIKHLGLSNVTDAQLTAAQAIAPVITVQNWYNVAKREDDALVDRCAREHIMYAPFFPLGGFTPLQSDELHKVAADLGTSPQQVALAWLLQRSPAIAVIPGTSSRTHLRENIAAVSLELPSDALSRLDAIGG